MLLGPRQLDSSDTAQGVRMRDLRLVGGTQKVAVVLNANAKRVTRRVRDAFAQVVPNDDLFFSTSLEQAERIAATLIERRYDTVLAGGGDGTIVNTMNMLLRAAEAASSGLHRPPLPDIGILRLGTGNGLGHVTGAGKPIDDVMRALSGERGRAHPMQLMENVSTGAVFPFASLGYDAQLLNDYVAVCRGTRTPMTSALSKTIAGYFYALATRTIPQQIRGEDAEVRVVATGRCSRIDPDTDEEIPLPAGATLFDGPARAVVMGTVPYYGYKMKVLPFAERRSDRFHVRVSTASIPQLLGQLHKVWDGSMRSDKLYDFLVEGVQIETSSDLPFQTSGDAMGYRRGVEVKLSERTFRVLEGGNGRPS